MQRFFVRVAVAAGVAFLLGVSFARAVDFPEPRGYVNDFADVVSASEEAELDSVLTQFERETSNEIVVATVASLEGLDAFSYSQQLFTAWGVGKEGRNNGVLFVIFPNDREAFVNVGPGLEGVLPDGKVGGILRSEVFPEFKNADYALGIRKGVDALIAASKNEYVAAEEALGAEGWIAGLASSGWGLFFIFVFFDAIASFLGRSKSWWLGGVIGLIFGTILSYKIFGGLTMLLGGFGGGALGLLFDFIFSKIEYGKNRGRGGRGGFWFGGGRGSGGGGGFGGFGGGISRGGGAGGRW